VGIGDEARGAEAVGVDVAELPVLDRRERLAFEPEVFGLRGASAVEFGEEFLVRAVEEVGGVRADGFADALAKSVVAVLGDGAAALVGLLELVERVVGVAGRARLRGVAVGIVAVALTACAL
jgi:hypothetical protein